MTNPLAIGKVRSLANDRRGVFSHTANVAKRTPKALTAEEYRALKVASGWYLKAWRHYRLLSLDELAAEVGTSKGAVSDFENGKGQRFNRDNLEQFARALNTEVGFLVDLNPFTVSPEWMDISRRSRGLDQEDQKTVADLVARLERKGAA
jgi:transcriptional regulator with XRE-family HTH domain